MRLPTSSAPSSAASIRRLMFALRRQPQLQPAAEAAFDVSLAALNRRFLAYVATTLGRS